MIVLSLVLFCLLFVAVSFLVSLKNNPKKPDTLPDNVFELFGNKTTPLKGDTTSVNGASSHVSLDDSILPLVILTSPLIIKDNLPTVNVSTNKQPLEQLDSVTINTQVRDLFPEAGTKALVIKKSRVLQLQWSWRENTGNVVVHKVSGKNVEELKSALKSWLNAHSNTGKAV